LGRPALEHGASADLLCFVEDPREVGVGNPDLVLLRGRVWG
jgi:imidazolonepropionase-like amidohydrolase